MSQNNDSQKLFSDFPPTPTTDWEAVIAKDLKGADYDKKLLWKTYENITVRPYYRMENLDSLSYLKTNQPGQTPFVRGSKKNSNDWNIRQDILNHPVKEANQLALTAIERSAKEIGFATVASTTDFSTLLKGIDPLATSLNFDWQAKTPTALSLFTKHLEQQKTDPRKVPGTFVYDPIAQAGLTGEVENFDKKPVVDFFKTAITALPCFKPLVIQSHVYHNAGASITQELACALSAGVDYLDWLTEAGLKVENIAPQLGFSFSVSSNYFFEIAKFRTARLLWTNILKEYGMTDDKITCMNIHAKTSAWNKTIYDAHVNMLRTTTEAMSAVIGGCDSLSVIPFDETRQLPNEFSYRIAQNTQLILKHEACFDKLIDPSAGSYYIESLTDALAIETWNLFKEIEVQGGLLSALRKGFVQEKIGKTRAEKEKNISQRRDVFVGTNQYPSKETLEISAVAPDTTTPALALSPWRGAQMFEEIRLKVEHLSKKAGRTPSIFLWTTGDITMQKARSAFVSNFFGCAGFDVIGNTNIPTVEEGLALVKETKPAVVVLCSSDKEYSTIAEPICTALKKQHPTIKRVLAGYPTEQIESLKQAGVEDFVHVKSNAIEVLKKYQTLIFS